MQNTLYPKRFDGICPYCRSTNIPNPLNFSGTIEEISIERHRIELRLISRESERR